MVGALTARRFCGWCTFFSREEKVRGGEGGPKFKIDRRIPVHKNHNFKFSASREGTAEGKKVRVFGTGLWLCLEEV